ncbi:MAG: hypothetical protein GY820_42475, partial [Gammaproteobacteria bacterium]|nr:hypothetical protein [Gammaproteobacteria bacterium]
MRSSVQAALSSIQSKRGEKYLPFLDTYRREHQLATIEAMAPSPPKMRMVGSIEDICTLEYNYRSHRSQWYPETGMELPVVGGRSNPLFVEHIQDRFSFLCMKSRMDPTVEFRQRYSLKWNNDQLYATPQDLEVHIMDQYEKVVPTRGDVNAYQLTNTFSTLFGT